MRTTFSLDEARDVGLRLGVIWNTASFTVEQFRRGMEEELEHGSRNPETNITFDDPIMTGKIALAHLRENPTYYDRIEMVKEGTPSSSGFVMMGEGKTTPPLATSPAPPAERRILPIPNMPHDHHHERNYLVPPAIILAIGIFVASIVGAYAFYKVRSLDNTLSVTGSAKVAVRADSGKWTGNFSRRVTQATLAGGYAQMDRDLREVRAFLTRKQIPEGDIVVSPVFTEEVYDYNPSGIIRPREYTLRQTVTVTSSNPDQLTVLANSTGELVARGVFFTANPVEYLYSKLPELRVSLLSDAIEDARARAAEIASASGTLVGPLRSAQSGVVQVLPRNSVEVADLGAYDTSSIEKEVMITVRAAFSVR